MQRPRMLQNNAPYAHLRPPVHPGHPIPGNQQPYGDPLAYNTFHHHQNDEATEDEGYEGPHPPPGYPIPTEGPEEQLVYRDGYSDGYYTYNCKPAAVPAVRYPPGQAPFGFEAIFGIQGSAHASGSRPPLQEVNSNAPRRRAPQAAPPPSSKAKVGQ